MHRFPNGARFDIPGLQMFANLFGPDSEPVFVEQHARQPASRVTPGRLRKERDPVDPPERRAIPSIDLAPPFDEPIQARQLCTADGG
jgi:hypothetical protein